MSYCQSNTVFVFFFLLACGLCAKQSVNAASQTNIRPGKAGKDLSSQPANEADDQMADGRHGSAGPASNVAAPTPPPYPKGIWASYGQVADLPEEVINNLGVVGLGISEDWSVVNPARGVYDWTTLDDKIAQAKAAGFKINLVISNSSINTPTWLLDDSLPVNPVRIALIDPASQHTTFCEPIQTCLYWDPVFQQARLDLVAAAAEHFSSDPDIVAVTAQFANYNSNDWNILDSVFPVGDELECPSCPTTPPQLCGPQVIDQPARWLAAGWTEQTMVDAGEELMDAYAAAFPKKNIKLPIGGMANSLQSKLSPPGDDGTYSTMARDMEDYVYGNADLGIPAKPYANRFYMQRNTLQADWESGVTYDTDVPDFDSDKYIRYMIRHHAPQSGIQMVEAATGGLNSCRLGGGEDGPCDNPRTPAVECADLCVMQAALDEAQTFGTSYIEIFPQDAQNPAFYPMITAATVAMGGTPRTPVVPDFSLSISPPSATVKRGGGTAFYTVTITPSSGFSSEVTLSITGLPVGATGIVAPNPATGSSTLTITVSPLLKRGVYPFTVTGVGGTPPLTRTSTATLVKSKKA